MPNQTFQYAPYRAPYTQDIARTILEQGNAQAQGTARAGEIMGGAMQQIVPTFQRTVEQGQQNQARQLQVKAATKEDAFKQALSATLKTTPKQDEDGVSVYDLPSIQQTLAQQGFGEYAGEVVNHLGSINDAFRKERAVKLQLVQTGAQAIARSGNDPLMAEQFLDHLKANRSFPEGEIETWRMQIKRDPTFLPKLTAALAGPQKYGTAPAGSSVMNEGTGEIVGSVPDDPTKGGYTINGQRFTKDGAPIGPQVPLQTPPSAALREWQDYKAQGGKLDFDAYQTMDANRKKPSINLSGMNALYADIDPKAIASQIRKGKHPPDIVQYGRPAAAAIASELAKSGPNGEAPFDLASAEREWKAQLKLNATMNGSQQVRLDESIRSGLAMYDRIDQLAIQWNGKGWGPLSRANLQAAREGALGTEAASLANQLTGQIGQLTSDVATIEQGGLTPTNESRAIAEKSMQDWWGTGTIKDMTAQGRYNMQIRHMARQTQETMTPGNNPDTSPANPATPAAGAGPIKSPATLSYQEYLTSKKK